MRVLHILNELRASGAEVMLTRAAPWWHAEGIESHVLAMGAKIGDYSASLETAGFAVHHLPFAPSISYLWALRRFIADGDYDIVHVHPERAFFWVALAARGGGTRHIVRSVHNVFSFTGALRFERRVQRAILRRLGVQFVSVSASVQRNEQYRFHNPTIHMRNWLDTRYFVPPTAIARGRARQQYRLDEDVLAVVTIGNCGSAKNHEAVIEAVHHLADLRPIYLHAGEEERDRPECRLATDLGVADHCRFLGRVETVRDLLYAADVFVMPSHYEGLGIAALEAAAVGLPCVLSRVPGLADLESVLGDGAVWVKPAAASVAAGIRVMGRKGRGAWEQDLHARVAAVFGVEHRAPEVAQFYRSLLGLSLRGPTHRNGAIDPQ